MKCKKCSSKISDNSNFCRKCGEPVIKDAVNVFQVNENLGDNVAEITDFNLERDTEDLNKTIEFKKELYPASDYIKLITIDDIKQKNVEDDINVKEYINNNPETSNLDETTSISSNMDINNIEITKNDNDQQTSVVKEIVYIRKNNPFLIVMLVLIFLLTVGLGYYIIKNPSKVVEKEKIAEKIVENKYVIFKGYKFIITDFKSYNLTQEDLILYDDNLTIHINILSGIKYSNILENKSKYEKLIEKDGYKVGSIQELDIDKQKYLIFDISDEDYRYLLGYTKFSSDDSIYFIIKAENELSNNYFKVTNKVLSEVKKEMTYAPLKSSFYVKSE